MNTNPYRIHIGAKTFRAASIQAAKRSLGRNMGPGAVGVVTYYGEPILKAVGTSTGWMEAK